MAKGAIPISKGVWKKNREEYIVKNKKAEK
jgi:hypothetical protein